MLLTERQEPRRKGRRRRASPPPAPFLVADPFEGAEILEELPDLYEDLLWQAARDVQLWVTVHPANRSGLFRNEQIADRDRVARICPELISAFKAIGVLRVRPEGADVKSISSACQLCYDWARRNDYLVTAATFAELAAWATPQDSTLATAAGRANRHAGAFARAKRWFDRAIALARRTGDQTAYAEALLTWGNMAFQRAEYGAARTLFARAWRKGRRYNLREMGAAARHNLMALEFTLGDHAAANEHGAAAFALYGRSSERLPFLAHDIAHLWTTEGYCELALRLLLASEPLITAPGEKLKVWANIGRAAAGAGRDDLFFEAWDRVSHESRTSSSPHLPEALVAIAEGSHSLGRSAQAAGMAERAVQAARKHKHGDAEQLALAALEKIRSGEAPPPAVDPPDIALALAARLLRALTR
jgi:tetratricopeptide (TPR) repeat protein